MVPRLHRANFYRSQTGDSRAHGALRPHIARRLRRVASSIRIGENASLLGPGKNETVAESLGRRFPGGSAGDERRRPGRQRRLSGAAILLSPREIAVPVTAVAVAIALGISGSVAAHLGGAPKWKSVLRTVSGGFLAMSIAYAIGRGVGSF